VAVELLPEDQWRSPSKVLPGTRTDAAPGEGGDDSAGGDEGDEADADAAKGAAGATLFEVRWAGVGVGVGLVGELSGGVVPQR